MNIKKYPKKLMKFAFNLTFSLFALLMVSDKSFSLTDYKIKKICNKEKRALTCIKNLQEKRFNLQKGKKIEIPVIPYTFNR